ncbi:MAG TPA: hypothetical protein VHM01_13320 [Alphaproteobacteria bacterium]|nr:hypothetical protein [Alphaproteobacteria bacterium]
MALTIGGGMILAVVYSGDFHFQTLHAAGSSRDWLGLSAWAGALDLGVILLLQLAASRSRR